VGNRAVITTKDHKIGVYLHWNGGRDSVEAFLKYCQLRDFRPPEKDSYGWARLCQVIGNFFGGGLSIGIDEFNNLDFNNYDNGTYVIENWQIIGREYFNYEEENHWKLDYMLHKIDEAQPEKDRIFNAGEKVNDHS
jgi:hypothetical protein